MLLPHTADWVPLRNSERSLPPGAKWLGPVDPAEPIMITIRVRAGIGTNSESDGVQPGLLRPTIPRPIQSAGREGADQCDLDRIQEFAGQAGFDIIEVSAARRSVVLWGTASAIKDVFRAQIVYYKFAGRLRRGQQGPVYVPRAIAHIVEDVSGLDDGLPEAASPAVASTKARRFDLRQAAIPLIALVAGGALGVMVYRPHGAERSGSPGRTADPVSAPRSSSAVPSTTAPSPPKAASSDVQLGDLESAAWRSLAAGQLRTAQDDFLKVLTLDPGRDSAMRGLVAVRRKMAGNDGRIIRQQVAVYQDALRRGATTDEYYTPSALQVLVSASLTAAHEVETAGVVAAGAPPVSSAPPGPSARPAADMPSSTGKLRSLAGTAKPAPLQTPTPPGGKLPQPAAPPAKVPVQGPTPPAKAANNQAVAAAPSKPAIPSSSASSRPVPPAAASPPAANPVASSRPAPPAPAPGSTPGPPVPAAAGTAAAPPAGPLYTFRVGPVLDSNRASALAKQLSAAGFSQSQVSARTEYRVVSEPLPRQAAQTLSGALAARGLQATTEPLTGDTVQLLFGTFTSRKDADTLAGRISAAGYDAWIRDTTSYTLRIGPYPQASMNTITQIVKTGAPEATVAADSPSSPPPVAAPPAPASVPAPARASAPAPAPAPSPAAAPAPASAPPAAAHAASTPADGLYNIRVGPVSDRERASALAKQLSAAGFSQAQVSGQQGYRVVSEPLPHQVGQTLSATLAARGFHITAEPLTGDTIQLVFGTFTSQKDADALAGRISAAGYDAWVRETTVYTLRLGPYPQASVNTVTQIIKTGAPDVPITEDPAANP